MAFPMDMENILMLLVAHIKENIKIIRKKEKVFLNGLLEQNMMANGKTI